jgi:general stress protein 26
MSSAGVMREVVAEDLDRHRVAWLTTETTLTRIRFAADGGKIYTSLGQDSVALREILGRPEVQISLGQGNRRVKGPEIAGMASVLAEEESLWARHLLARKYWWLRVSFWRRVVVEIELA